MPTIYTESFETIPSWFGGKGTVVAGRTGNAVSLTGNEAGTAATAPAYSIPVGSRNADTTLDFWFKMSALGSSTRRICQMLSPAGTPVATVAWSALQYLGAFSGDMSTAIGQGAGNTNTTLTIAANTWHRMTLHIIMADVGGTIEASLDGTMFAWTTNWDTKPGASAVIETFNLWGNRPSGTDTTTFDDLTLATPTPARVAAEAVDVVVVGASPAARITGEAVEAIVGGGSASARVGAEQVEAVVVGVPARARMGGMAIEVLVPLGPNAASDLIAQTYLAVRGVSSADLVSQVYYAVEPSLVLPSNDVVSQIYVAVKAPSSRDLAVQVYENTVAVLSTTATAVLVVYRR